MKREFASDRRTFLKGTAIFGGLALLLRLDRPASADPPLALPQQAPPGGGYQLTAHVRKYYETARL
jgi:hypothetical protein